MRKAFLLRPGFEQGLESAFKNRRKIMVVYNSFSLVMRPAHFRSVG
jgi:hypothetical protein